MKKDQNLKEEIKHQLVNFETETGWYSKLIESASTNLNSVMPMGQIKREYHLDLSTYQIIIDLHKMTVELYSQSFLRSASMKIEFSKKFDPSTKQLYNILKDHVAHLPDASSRPLIDLGMASMDNPVTTINQVSHSNPSFFQSDTTSKHDVIYPGFCTFDWGADDTIFCVASQTLSTLR